MSHVASQSGGLERSSPEALGISSASVEAFLDQVKARGVVMHSFMVLRHGKVAAEGWWAPYEPRTPHRLYSLSKSFTSTAIGMAIEEGLFGLDDHVASFFPDKLLLDPSPNLLAMTIRHLLTMSTGQVEADRPMPSREPGAEWVPEFLSQPVPREPGSVFDYSTMATFMCSAILNRVAGIDLLDYLMPRLFEPLGIEKPTWERSPEGISVGGSGLYLPTESVAKFGQLYLNRGVWNGQRLIPEGWIDLATSKQISNDANDLVDWRQGYGFQFWRCRHDAYRGDGAFGQFCVVCPEQDLVFVATASVDSMQTEIDCFWETIFAGLGKPVAGGSGELGSRLAALRLEGPEGSAPPNEAVLGVPYSSGEGSCMLNVVPGGLELRIIVGGKEVAYRAGYGNWTPFQSAAGSQLTGRAAWVSAEQLSIECVELNSPLKISLDVQFEGDSMSVKTAFAGTFEPADAPEFVGTSGS